MTWLRREDLEDEEFHRLGPWAAKAVHSGGRRLPEPEDPLRTCFVRDRDRILHSKSFRRLQHKTQVLAAFEGDHYRSRMIHSLEVAQMARGVARALRLNADLAEAVALAHDLGHPPFGHVGEERLHALMADHGGFRHNAQGVRIVDVLEGRDGHGRGLNLTLAVRRSMLKGRVPDGFPLNDDLLPVVPPTLEAHVVDLCDRIAYLCHDLDDGLRAGIFQRQDAAGLELWRRASEGGDPPTHALVSRLTSLLIHDLVEATDTALEEATPGHPPRIGHTPAFTAATQELLGFLRERFYRSDHVMEVMRAGSDRIETLFRRWCKDPADLPPEHRGRIEQHGVERAVCDYLAGMTDRFLMRCS